jgi:hypothetical protein
VLGGRNGGMGIVGRISGLNGLKHGGYIGAVDR